ncbi:MAG: HAMP domain-containing sensor histidine kinase [Pacificimonas sp.]
MSDGKAAGGEGYLAALAHELKTPLGAILGYAELIAAGHGTAAQTKSHAAILWEAAQALSGTVDTMLDYARLQSGHAELAEESVDLAAAAESASRMLATSAANRDVGIDLRIPPDLPHMTGDARMMRQVILNLLSNAIKYGGEGRRVRLTARIDPRGRIILDVMDEGTGISDADAQLAMQPFERLNAASSVPGNGLGLPLTKALVELHDGSFRLIGTPGKGTRALCILPTARVQGPLPDGQHAFQFTRPPKAAPRTARRVNYF